MGQTRNPETRRRFAVGAHSYAELYNTLTRGGEAGPYKFAPAEAWVALESLRAITDLLGLTPAQTLDGIRRHAQGRGMGPKLYDALIGQVAVAHDLPTIVTWNVRHMRGLFPNLSVITPTEYAG